jgi:hypothetical protein
MDICGAINQAHEGCGQWQGGNQWYMSVGVASKLEWRLSFGFFLEQHFVKDHANQPNNHPTANFEPFYL